MPHHPFPRPRRRRMRRYRERQRDGLRCLTIELRETEIDALIQKGLLTGTTARILKQLSPRFMTSSTVPWTQRHDAQQQGPNLAWRARANLALRVTDLPNELDNSLGVTRWPDPLTVVARRARPAPRLTCAGGTAKACCGRVNTFHGHGRATGSRPAASGCARNGTQWF